jgi:hypothetical protein
MGRYEVRFWVPDIADLSVPSWAWIALLVWAWYVVSGWVIKTIYRRHRKTHTIEPDGYVMFWLLSPVAIAFFLTIVTAAKVMRVVLLGLVPKMRYRDFPGFFTSFVCGPR